MNKHKVYVREVVNYIHEFEAPADATPEQIEALGAKSWIENGSPTDDFYEVEERCYEIEGSDRPSFEDDEIEDYPPCNEKEARDRLDALG